MASAVDKVLDDTDRAIKGVDVSNLTKEQEDALEHQIEKEVADSIQEAKSCCMYTIFCALGNGLAQVRSNLRANSKCPSYVRSLCMPRTVCSCYCLPSERSHRLL